MGRSLRDGSQSPDRAPTVAFRLCCHYRTRSGDRPERDGSQSPDRAPTVTFRLCRHRRTPRPLHSGCAAIAGLGQETGRSGGRSGVVLNLQTVPRPLHSGCAAIAGLGQETGRSGRLFTLYYLLLLLFINCGTKTRQQAIKRLAASSFVGGAWLATVTAVQSSCVPRQARTCNSSPVWACLPRRAHTCLAWSSQSA